MLPCRVVTIEILIKIGHVKKLKPHNFIKFGSARKLYNFNIDHVSDSSYAK